MADYYTSTGLLKAKRKGRDAWQGVLKYAAPNPAYIEDPRAPEQRRKSYGQTPNPDYVADPRKPEQRNKTIVKQVRKVFDPDAVKTKSQAMAALSAWHAQMELEHGTPDANLTVNEYVSRYISRLEKLYNPNATGTKARSGISPTTRTTLMNTDSAALPSDNQLLPISRLLTLMRPPRARCVFARGPDAVSLRPLAAF